MRTPANHSRDVAVTYPEVKRSNDIDKHHRSYTSLQVKAMPTSRPRTIALTQSPLTTPNQCMPTPRDNEIRVATTLSIIETSTNKKTSDKTATKRRMDEPPVYNHKRGDKRLALRVASDPSALEAAERNYELDKSSRGDTSNFNVITWVELHNAYGRAKEYTHWPVLPLTPATNTWRWYSH